MRIGIDARLWGPENGGLGRYITELILHLEQLDTTAEFFIFLQQKNWNDFTPRTPQFHKVMADIPWYGWREQIQLPRILKHARVDLMHFPHWNVPLAYAQPFVVTVHDLLLLHYPTRKASTRSWLTYAAKHAAFTYALRHALKQSRHIITPSEYTKNDIVNTLRTPKEKITAIPLGVDSASTDLTNTARTEIKKRLGEDPYALYVGVSYPHKNLSALLAAWKIVERKTNFRYRLVLSGPPGYFYNHLLKTKEARECQKLTYLGFTREHLLPALYSGAAVYVFPSLYEGFGFPALEAMRYGVPVVSSNRTCLPETLGNAALYVDPANPEELAGAIERGLTDAPLRGKLIHNGHQRISQYQWQTCAQKTWEVYQNSVY